jgi:hypothetical protein
MKTFISLSLFAVSLFLPQTLAFAAVPGSPRLGSSRGIHRPAFPAQGRSASRFSKVSLNPQPLPPRIFRSNSASSF